MIVNQKGQSLVDHSIEELYRIFYQLRASIIIHEKQYHHHKILKDLYEANQQGYIINLYQIFEFKEHIKSKIDTKKIKDAGKLSILENIYYLVSNKKYQDQIIYKIQEIHKIICDCLGSAYRDDVRHGIAHINYNDISSIGRNEYRNKHGVIGTMEHMYSKLPEIKNLYIEILETYFKEQNIIINFNKIDKHRNKQYQIQLDRFSKNLERFSNNASPSNP